VWVIKCHISICSVIGSRTGDVADPERHTRASANSGRNLLTGSFSSKRPSSHSISAATDVIGFVIE
jgi:hypothetical protein